MATRLNPLVRTNLLDTGIDTDFDSGVLEIRSGSQPALATDPASGTLLVSIALPADAFGAPSSGQMAKAGTWSAVAATGGVAGWFRLRNGADTERIDGAVGAEMTLDNTTIANGQTVTITAGTITMPAS